MPLGTNVDKNMQELAHSHPDWTHERRLAASLDAARRAGNTTVKPPSTLKRRNKRTRAL